jgi:hypothetical protein
MKYLLAVLLLVLVSVGWGNVGLQYRDSLGEHQRPFYVVNGETTDTQWPDYACHWDSKLVAWVSDTPTTNCDGKIFHFGNQIPIPLVVVNAKGTWSFPKMDSLSARVERVEKTINDSFICIVICIVIGVFYSTILFLSKKWMEVHK